MALKKKDMEEQKEKIPVGVKLFCLGFGIFVLGAYMDFLNSTRHTDMFKLSIAGVLIFGIGMGVFIQETEGLK